MKSIVLVGAATMLAIGAGVTAKLQLASEDLPAQPPAAVAPAEAGSPDDDDATMRTRAEESTEDDTFDPAEDSMTGVPTDDPTIPGYGDDDHDDEDNEGPETDDDGEEDEEHDEDD